MKDDFTKDVSDLAADALVSAGLLSKEDFEKASEIIQEEFEVRLAIENRVCITVSSEAGSVLSKTH